MAGELAIDVLRQALLLAVVVSAPVLLATFATGFVVSLLQAMTGLQDVTVGLVPRLALGALALLWVLPWMLERVTEFSTELYRGIPLGL
jgi:flagellar biosynthetic protein FliQ